MFSNSIFWLFLMIMNALMTTLNLASNSAFAFFSGAMTLWCLGMSMLYAFKELGLRGPEGPRGNLGPRGAVGPAGASGADGECRCKCPKNKSSKQVLLG